MSARGAGDGNEWQSAPKMLVHLRSRILAGPGCMEAAVGYDAMHAFNGCYGTSHASAPQRNNIIRIADTPIYYLDINTDAIRKASIHIQCCEWRGCDRLRQQIIVRDPGLVLWSSNLVSRAFARCVPGQLTAAVTCNATSRTSNQGQDTGGAQIRQGYGSQMSSQTR